MAGLLRIALVAGEASGDILGSGLMRAIKARHPEVEFIGVGGPLMEAEGMVSHFPMERLSVMGLVEVQVFVSLQVVFRADQGVLQNEFCENESH